MRCEQIAQGILGGIPDQLRDQLTQDVAQYADAIPGRRELAFPQHPKLVWLVEAIDDLRAQRDRVVVFSRFNAPLVWLNEHLRKQDVRVSFLHGALSPAVPVRDPANWEVAIDGMVAVVHGPTGTARSIAADLPYTLAGKTGTAQRVSRREGQRAEDLARHLRHQALFVALAPAPAPEIVVVVIVEGGGSGSRTAAPVARQILDAWWSFRGRTEGGAT